MKRVLRLCLALGALPLMTGCFFTFEMPESFERLGRWRISQVEQESPRLQGVERF